MKKRLLLISVAIIVLLIMYLAKIQITTTQAFYYWKQDYSVTSTQQPKYIKVLDIAYDNKPILHQTKFSTKPTHQIVPVIYIDNPLFRHINAKDFAHEIHAKLQKISNKTFSYDEIQIDCDWSESTRVAYFNFLEELKKLSNKTLSTTIRLHQIKYHKRTGVPPVDKGILMYYNMSNFKDLETKNYILDLELAKKYHYNFDTYPLALDLALPLYAQATIIRFEAVVGFIEGVRTKNLNENFQRLKNNHYKIKKTHYFKGRLLYKGDVIRIDEVSSKDLNDAINNLKEVMKQPKEIIFYRWGNRQEYPKLKDLMTW